MFFQWFVETDTEEVVEFCRLFVIGHGASLILCKIFPYREYKIVRSRLYKRCRWGLGGLDERGFGLS